MFMYCRIGLRKKELVDKLFEEHLKVQKQMQYNKIYNSEYVIRYRELCTLGIPEYLRKRNHKDT